MKPVYFESDGYRLKGTLFYPSEMKEKNPAVLFIHGWAADETRYVERAKAVAEARAVALIFDLRGHGASEGDRAKFSRKDHLQDVLTAFDFLTSQPEVDKTRMGVCGVSYGGHLASLLLGKRKLKWFALRAPALYPNRGFKTPTATLIKKFPDICTQTGQTVKNNTALKTIFAFNGSCLLVESKYDSIISHETIECYLTVLKDKDFTYEVIEANHALETPEMKQLFIDELRTWYHSQINKSS